MHVEARDQPWLLSILFLTQGLSLAYASLIQLDWLVCKLWEFTCSLLPRAETRITLLYGLWTFSSSLSPTLWVLYQLNKIPVSLASFFAMTLVEKSKKLGEFKLECLVKNSGLEWLSEHLSGTALKFQAPLTTYNCCVGVGMYW